MKILMWGYKTLYEKPYKPNVTLGLGRRGSE
jgi:hypothetical protein